MHCSSTAHHPFLKRCNDIQIASTIQSAPQDRFEANDIFKSWLRSRKKVFYVKKMQHFETRGRDYLPACQAGINELIVTFMIFVLACKTIENVSVFLYKKANWRLHRPDMMAKKIQHIETRGIDYLPSCEARMNQSIAHSWLLFLLVKQ